MRLSQKRKGAIYRAVHERIVDGRLEALRFMESHGINASLRSHIDGIIARAHGEAASAAVKAAEGAIQ